MELGFNIDQIKELLAGGRSLIEVMKEYAPIFLDRFKSHKSGVIKRQQQEKGINDYIATCLSRNYYMNTIVFRGQQKCILDLYVPLHIRKRSMRVTALEVSIDENVITALSEYDRVMIVDTAGMGKTTIVKYIALQVILSIIYSIIM